ncbi:UNVERIFIED_CONTAM: D-tagatose-1,6-bisphosphate aldolase subunit GatY [Sesamum radiatum]|uniref:D-tagatose-1,6-bisphosphate aldolase subunit GatY n=1 Tax=Sesamum radiatum TaxID=300843 RepID=A0AAW2WKG9_SESRA
MTNLIQLRKFCGAGSAAGWGRIDDSAVVKVYETLTGVKVEGKPHALNKESVLRSLPPEWPTDPINDIISLTQKSSKTLVVLDDDPTGTQTVHDIDVLTEWRIESLVAQFRKKPKCFFILTNSRAISSEKASALITEICRNLSAASKTVENTDYTVVLRGDSTLRGETEFAKDASFGYKSSNLREWVEEKTSGRIPASSIASISIQLLRKGGPGAVCELLCSLKKGSTCIVNAASERDMAVFAAGMIQAELKGKSFLCRSAASFVSARVGIIPKAPLLPSDLRISRKVEELLLQRGHALKQIEVSVDKIALKSVEEREEEINHTAEVADVYIKSGKDTLIMTSRQLVVGKTASESLEINFKVSSALVEIVRRISTRPRYILAKGGITSSDLATKALGAKQAKVVGQAMAGVPLWQLGPESRHPGVPYIVFPENGGYAVGAFNVYNLEGVEAVVAAAEEQDSPAILQVPITVHFDHGSVKQELLEILELGFDSLMVDGSHLPFEENVAYTKYISVLAHSKKLMVEAELGRLSGTEDDLTVEDYEARLTDVNQAHELIDATGIDALAVCVGNVHGKYPASGPNLRLDLLKDLYDLCLRKGVYLVLHGASGLSKDIIEECIKLGVRKFNVNTEVRRAYMDSLANTQKDLVHVMQSAKEAMKAVVAEDATLWLSWESTLTTPTVKSPVQSLVCSHFSLLLRYTADILYIGTTFVDLVEYFHELSAVALRVLRYISVISSSQIKSALFLRQQIHSCS